MSGLVVYDSSSDEEPTIEHTAPKASPVPGKLPVAATDATKIQPAANDREANSSQDLDGNATMGPMIGPAPPPEDEDEQGAPPVPAEMSERDVIRYWTDAPVPSASLPPSPPGSPDPAANERFARFLELKATGVHFNHDLAGKVTFRNPGLLATMMARAGVEEGAQYNTSLPRDLWDPTGFPEWAYKEGLLKSQQEMHNQNEANRKRLSATGKRTIDFTGESNSGGSSRRSTPGQQAQRRRP